MYILPDGFEISKKAEGKHGKSQALVVAEGRPLTEVLKEFMSVVTDVVANGGKCVAHQIEFDGGIIYRELGRCGLSDLQRTWERVLRTSSFCTMDPDLGRWALQSLGEEVGEPWLKHTLTLRRIFKLLCPQKRELLENQHDAAYDAIMTRMIYVVVLRQARLFRSSEALV